MVFCNLDDFNASDNNIAVTILILIDGFLQCLINAGTICITLGHNPYFNRWFSAMKIKAFFIH